MSAPSRGRSGVAATRGTTSTPRGRGTFRNNAVTTTRGRGRGRGGSSPTTATPNNAAGLLQKLRNGTVQRPGDEGADTTPRGRGTGRGQPGLSTRARGSVSRTFNRAQSPRSTTPTPTTSPAPPSSHKNFTVQMNEKFQLLKPKRDAERKRAIQDGFLADPEKKMDLANAITPVGTCTDMCPQFERVERIVQNMVDKAEKVPNEATGRDVPSEDRMVKRFRRSAAGYDEQLPSDIRTPETLRRTLDYLLDRVIGGGERLASIHKFVWDRTRGIRNDFSIQQVSRKEDVKIAVDCYERIARFHILSLHQLSNPDNLQDGEHFDAHQEREQLNNTLLSLMYYYDDNRGVIPLPNEPEFRSYCILFELQALTPDLEDRMQAWPVDLLNHPQIQTAFKLYAAAGNTIMDQGPLRPAAAFSVAQSNAGRFWTVLSSHAVSYIMACVAEINFSIVRFTALDALWRSAKSSPPRQQQKNEERTLAELQNYLAFDDEDDTIEFCEAFDLAFKNSDSGEQCLDFTAVNTSVLDKSSIPSQQVFSHGIVERKRYKRTLVAIINGVSVATAIRQGLVVELPQDEDDDQQQDASGGDQSMFIPEQSAPAVQMSSAGFGSNLNPFAPVFTPSMPGDSGSMKQDQSLTYEQIFGSKNKTSPSTTFGFGTSTPSGAKVDQPQFGADDTASQSQNPFRQQPIQSSGLGFSAAGTTPLFSQFGQPGIIQKAASPTLDNKPSIAPPTVFGQPTPNSLSVSQISGFPGGFTPQKTPQQPSVPGTGQTEDASTGREENTQSRGLPAFSSIFGQQILPKQQQQQQSQIIDAEGTPSTIATPSSTFNLASTTAPAPEAKSSSSAAFPQPASQTPSKPIFSFTSATTDPQRQSNPRRRSSESAEASAPFTLTDAGKPPRTEAPVFSFAQPSLKPQSDLSRSQRNTTTEASTTPQGTPKQRKSGEYDSKSVGTSRDVIGKPLGLPSDVVEQQADQQVSLISTAKEPPPSGSDTSIFQTTTQVVKPKFTEADRVKLVANTSRLILTQPQGLIEYFVSHHVSNLLQTLVRQYLQDRQDELMTNIRIKNLLRKYFAIWRANIQKLVMTRRARQRRKLLAAAMQAEQNKRQRDEAELEAILAATRETKRIQDEQKTSRSHEDSQQIETRKNQALSTQPSVTQVAGQKRKTASTNENPRSVSTTLKRPWPSHKRSKTIETLSEPSTSMRLSASSSGLHGSPLGWRGSRFGQPSPSRSTSSADQHGSLSHKVDSTRTDYFKLKAMGISPATPLIPETTKSLAMKKLKEQEAKDALLARSKQRPSGFATSTISRQSTPMQPPPRPVSMTPMTPPPAPSHNVEKPAKSGLPSEEDPFLQQLRIARESLAEDIDWFKNQYTTLEKQIEEHEELRRSQNSQTSSRRESPQTSLSGLAKANGYEYYPAEAKSGKALSRTEERIRRTGAHGFATRPIGNGYVPVAMSRQSALRYGEEATSKTDSVVKKRLRGWSKHASDDAANLKTRETERSPNTKRTRTNGPISQNKSHSINIKSSVNVFAALQQDDLPTDDEEELEEDDEEEVETNHYDHNGDEGDTEDNEEYDDDELIEEDDGGEDGADEDEDEEADDEDDEGEDEENISGHIQGQSAQYYALLANNVPISNNAECVYNNEEDEGDEEEDEDDEDDGTPGTYPQFSRAQSGSSAGFQSQSGPGASADDALVLSD